jgi:putative methionine-R-sulfoxide reductase with GAF domain/HAMP domain-containing protein
MNQRRYKLTTIGPVVISAILVFVFVILYVVSSRAGAANIQEGLDAVSLPVMTTTAKLLFNPLYNLDLTKMSSTLDPYVDGTNVVYAAVYDLKGQQIVEINNKWGPDIAQSQRLATQAINQQDIVRNQQESYLILTKPISAGTTTIGAVEIVFDIAPLQAALGRSETIISITLFLALIATTFTFYVVFRYVFRPLNRLALVAQEISQGNTTVKIPLDGSEEVHNLAVTLAELIEAERASVTSLEQRVADRTRDLEIVAEVGTATATILDSKRLLQEVVDLTKERFNLYHSHIYLLDEEGRNLVLTAGAGEPGRIMVAEGHSIPLDREQSLVARAARERKGVRVNDVTQAADFLPNPLLPDTHSELAVPMIVGGNMIGVFDIQSEQVGRFTDSDVNIQTTLAAQLATSVQNVRTYEQSRRQAELESLANAIGQKIQRTTSIEETLQIASRELGTAVGALRVKVQIGGQNGNN